MSRQLGDWRTDGNSYDRRRRREWMIETFGIPRKRDGKKTRIACVHCGKRMRAHGRKATLADGRTALVHTWEVDRIVCGHAGGRYVRGNVQPSCKRCNATRCTTAKKCRRGAPRKVRPIFSYPAEVLAAANKGVAA